MTTLRILPVYSEIHSDPAYQFGPIRLLRHQVETWEAFGDNEIDVVINTAMTGDGKSLAAYMPALKDRKCVVAMYPTNELIRDQYDALPKYEHRPHLVLPKRELMYSGRITQLAREHATAVRMETVRGLLKYDVLLTNPDLIYLMMSHQYGWGHLLKELPALIGANFDYLLFDEFHVFDVPQIIAVMNMLGYLQVNYRDKPHERRKFVFLSATPNRLMDTMLARGGIRCRYIEGHYHSTELTSYRRILQPCTLELHGMSQEQTTEMWIEERIEDIHAFFKQHPGSKAAILVYSVATAKRLVKLLKDRLQEPYGITIGENTGLTGEEERRASFKKDLLVGTSTVDIGVDFHINYLIFEAYGAGGFLQRFGRLGRHDEFDRYYAHALLPRFVVERLETRFSDGEELEREKFNEAIREVFPVEQEFKHYTRRWGVVQAQQVVMTMQEERDENTAFTEAVIEQYERFYGSDDKPVMRSARGNYYWLRKNAPEMLGELQSFRGQSPLSCGVWDMTDNDLKIYDLFFLLANTRIEVLEEEEFMQEVRRRGKEEREFSKQLLYLRVHDYVAERQQMLLAVNNEPHELTGTMQHAHVRTGFFVREPRITDLDQINLRLKRLKLTCVLSTWPRQEIKSRMNLDALFGLYRMQDATGNEYSAAFGQDALLLDSIPHFRFAKVDDGPMIY